MIGSYFSVFRRRAKVIAVLTAILAPLLFVTLIAGGQRYESSAVVQTGSDLVADVVGLSTAFETPESKLATEIEFFESDIVTDRAHETLAAQGWTESAEELGERISVTPRGVSPLLDVVGTDNDRTRARQLTDAFVTAYVTYRQDTQRATLQAVIDDLLAQQAQAEADLTAALGQPADASSAQERQIASAQSWYDTLSDRIEEARLRVSVDTSGVAVLSPASPAEPVDGFGPALTGVLAVLGGLLAASGVALLLDVLRDPVRTRDEAQSLVSVRVLGEVPQGGAGAPKSKSAQARAAASAARGLRLRLERLHRDVAPRTVMVVAVPSDSDAGTTVAAALATSYAEGGRRVAVVIDLDQSAPASGQAFHLMDQTERVGTDLVARRTTADGVWLLPATSTDGHSGFLDHASPAAVLADLHASFDVVLLVDARSSALDAAAVGHLADATLILCAIGRTPARRLEELVNTLADYGVSVDGVVLTVPWHGRQGRHERSGERAATPQSRATAKALPAARAAEPATERAPLTAVRG